MKIINANTETSIQIPLFETVQAEFPSPAEGFQSSIDLNRTYY